MTVFLNSNWGTQQQISSEAEGEGGPARERRHSQEEGYRAKRSRTERSDTETEAAGAEGDHHSHEGGHDQHLSH